MPSSNPPSSQYSTQQSPNEVLDLDAYRSAWQEGHRPNPEDYLPPDPALRTTALCRLVELDLELQWRAGNGQVVESYLARFPELAADSSYVLRLIETEYDCRRQVEPRLSLSDYVRRFPEQGRQLMLIWKSGSSSSQASTVDPCATPDSASAEARDSGETLPTIPSASAAFSSDGGTLPTLGVPALDRASETPPAAGGTLANAPAALPAKREWRMGKLPHLPGYTIEEILGRGGMGVVYKARQDGLKRLVALKMILAGGQAGWEQQARFRAEAHAVARLQHPHIIQIYEIGEHDGQSYFSLEFADGGSLAGRLEGSPQSPRQSAHLVRALAQAMDFAHQQGIVHRDLKPANILLASVAGCSQAGSAETLDRGRWTPKIADFGLAKQLADDSGQTQSGAIVGTPSYMSPEQAEGRIKDIGPATDIYALGAILYEMLTGRPPFKGANVIETLEQVRVQEPVPPTRLQPKVPRDLETICLKCLQKEAARRYAGAAQLAEDLRRFLDEEPILARPVGEWSQLWYWYRRNRQLAWVSTLAAGAIGVVITLVVLFATSATDPDAATRLAEERRRASLAEAEANKHRLRLWEEMSRADKAQAESDGRARQLEQERLRAEQAQVEAAAQRRRLEALQGIPLSPPSTSRSMPPSSKSTTSAGQPSPSQPRANGFDWNTHNNLRHQYGATDVKKSLYHCDIIFQNSLMDGYTLDCLGARNSSRDQAIKDLCKNARRFPEYRFVKAACLLRAAQLYGPSGQQNELLLEVSSIPGDDLAIYRAYMTSKLFNSVPGR